VALAVYVAQSRVQVIGVRAAKLIHVVYANTHKHAGDGRTNVRQGA
jgi:hypothetical protein